MKSFLVLSLFLTPLFSSILLAKTTDNLSVTNSLKSSFSNAFKMGVAVNDDIVSGNAESHSDLVKKHFNTITLENSMKAEVVNPQPGVYDFTASDIFVKYAKQQGMFIVGHTLVWHNQTPQWFFTNAQGESNTPEEQLEIMHQYIKKVATRYATSVDAWDVVNEIMGEEGKYRNTSWVQRIGNGDDVVKAAFRYAEKYAPNTELYYNDFNAWRPEKRDGIIRMINMLQKANIRIDGIGIQAHWGLNFPSKENIIDAIDAYSALGIKVMITELDIDVLPFTKEGQVIGQGMMHPQFQRSEFTRFLDPYKDGLPEDIQQQLTKRYQSLFELFYSKKEKIDRVTFWGLDDSMSWKNNYPIPNRTNYPLLWDRGLNPKPALTAIVNITK